MARQLNTLSHTVGSLVREQWRDLFEIQNEDGCLKIKEVVVLFIDDDIAVMVAIAAFFLLVTTGSRKYRLMARYEIIVEFMLRAPAMHASVCGSQGCHISKRSMFLPLAIQPFSNPMTCMSLYPIKISLCGPTLIDVVFIYVCNFVIVILLFGIYFFS